MRVRLERCGADDRTVTMRASVTFDGRMTRLTYPTRTGALLRIDGTVAGAFDGKHATLDLPPLDGTRELTLTVEQRSLPTSGLPSGDGLRWRRLLALAKQRPHEELGVGPAPDAYGALPGAGPGDPPMLGHAHLDVAWLWTYADTRRKALRTFATAVRQLTLDDRFTYAQSQPQLYAWVEADDAELFARMREHAGRGWDASVATMWVEPDLHAPSGESILRQFAYGVRYTTEKLGVVPDVVWLPDTFGFPNTLPTLAAHAGMRYFATTKLQWNETTRWPHPQFCWYGDDGSHLVAAVIDRYDGEATPIRKAIARERREILVHGYGDGGGGVLDGELAAEDRATRPWQSATAWFGDVDRRTLPQFTGELYLETHRGTYTTHRDVKSRNAALERALGEAEELCAWCVAVRVPRSAIAPLLDDLRTAWTLVLRNQFHDVIAGSSIGAVYADALEGYEKADRIVARIIASARSILPRADIVPAPAALVAPVADGNEFVFANDYLRARVRKDGTVVELAGVDGRNLAALANGLMLYIDRPRSWDAWNLDVAYERRPRKLRPGGAHVEDGALIVKLRGDGTAIAMRVALGSGEPYLRIELNVGWQAKHRILRAEHRFAMHTDEVRFGMPHGSLVRTAKPRTPAERARFEIPAQRWVHAGDTASGVAIFAADTYGWSALALRGGGVRIGTSLLRAPVWPDPQADRGEHHIAYALAPTAGATIGALEAAWRDYAEPERVRLFTCDDPAVLVVATKPADDGDGIIVRVRECDGETRRVDLRCGGRMSAASAVDACERPIAGEARVDGELLCFVLPAFALRTFRVRP
ncbi:MAG TPA: glycoside hydrolase family 38 C-terminal domain-containing protein [Candidatus Lustribacter sp.]|jgi:alpha-mannosidase|nr:glycoside hydrolase family 38 C-terminal domain-containing protein [Candidatus Lustribacter sp.]